MTQNKQIRRYVRAVGSYLPCAGKQKRQLLSALRSEVEAYCAENDPADLVAHFGTPQQVAAAYVDDMSTHELLTALRHRRQILTILLSGVLAALLLRAAALCISLHDYHQAMNGWYEITITEE